jgi:uroporphyrinogen-III synthase
MHKAAAKAGLLAGWRVLVTRAKGQSPALAEPLRQRGAEVVEIPTIEIHPPASYAALDRALLKIGSYTILILTSVNGVTALFERCRLLGLPLADLKQLLTVAIGPATAQAMRAKGLAVSVMPKRYVAESIVEALRGRITGEGRVLLVRAKVARDVLPTELRKMGAEVDVIEAYETRIPKDASRKLKEIFSNSSTKPHVVTFTSSSTASNLLELLGERRQDALHDVCLASIGPVTSATLIQAGLQPTVEARQYTMQGLVMAIAEFAMTTNREHTDPATR